MPPLNNICGCIDALKHDPIKTPPLFIKDGLLK